ncbi:hypothetical protein Dda_6896 [Drechslerella dactyloides]|uniref:Secreted protein n=1 Tax=Drechslerella dactyloides TaxID=74499 RepID=A0AAD6IYE2_DREDA|nr:hypothetical protein Dda_6896 [Drechslerella dactyloides]
MLYLNHYLTLMLSASALVCQSLSAPTPDASLTPPGDVWIGDFTYGGTGCPDGTAWVGLSSDRSSFSAYFRKFVARTSGDITESRKFCQFNLALKSPPGWQYKITIGAVGENYSNTEVGVAPSWWCTLIVPETPVQNLSPAFRSKIIEESTSPIIVPRAPRIKSKIPIRPRINVPPTALRVNMADAISTPLTFLNDTFSNCNVISLGDVRDFNIGSGNRHGGA